MRRRQIKLGLLLAVVLLLLVAGAIGAIMKPNFQPDQIVPARFGDVAWNHDQHARMTDIANCQVCHHKERPGTTQPRPCRRCHKPQKNQTLLLADLHVKTPKPKYEKENGPPPMTAFHGKCVGCHKAMNKGPVGCRDCHAQKFSGAHGEVSWNHTVHARRIDMTQGGTLPNNCVRCHHQDKDATKDADYRACSTCHKAAPAMGLSVVTGIAKHKGLKHFDCERCHVQFNPEQGRRSCKNCHKPYAVDTKKTGKRPPLEQAVHARCAECHNPDYPQLEEGMPLTCRDCHKPDPSLLADLEVGLIMWDHDRHAKYGEGMSCITCHHTDKPGQPHMACKRCHGTGLYKNPPVAEALRKRCLGCHKEKKNGLVSWQQIDTEKKDLSHYVYKAAEGELHWNHREHAVSWSLSCRNCHHGLLKKDGAYVMASKVPSGEWRGKATEIQVCKNCHGPEGPVAGSPAEGSKAPGLDKAMKKICIECHKRLGGGPQTWADFFKVEPVKRAAPAPVKEQ